MIDPTRIAEIRARMEAATPGPLEANSLNGWPRTADEMKDDLCRCIDLSFEAGTAVPCLFVVSTGPHEDALFVAITGCGPTSEANAHLIANSPADITYLLAALDAAQAERDAATARAEQAEAEATALRAEVARLGPERWMVSTAGGYIHCEKPEPLPEPGKPSRFVCFRRVMQEGAPHD